MDRKQEQEDAIRQAAELADRKRREALQRAEEARLQRLLSLTQRWKQAAEIREFVRAVRRHPDANQAPESLDRWAAWALSEADWMDPMASPLSELLDAFDAAAPDTPLP